MTTKENIANEKKGEKTTDEFVYKFQQGKRTVEGLSRAGIQLIARLTAMGLRKEDIAARVGVSMATIYRWEKGTRPHRQFAKKLSVLLADVEKRLQRP